MNKLIFSKFNISHRGRLAHLFLFVVAGGLGFLAVWSLLGLVVGLGRHVIPFPGDLIADYFIGVSWAIILGVSILFWPVPSADKKALLWIWGVKSIVVLVIMLAYEYHYGFDIDGYFANALVPNFILGVFKLGDGTRNIAQLVWLHNKIMFDSYYAAKIGFALIGMIGTYLFYRAALLFLQRRDIRVLYVFAFFPSILFWSSILGKEPITFFGVSLCVYGVTAWYRLKQLRYLLLFVIGILIIALIRTWLAPIIILPLFILVLFEKRKFVWRIALIVIIIFIFGIALSKAKATLSVVTIGDFFKFRSYATTAFVGGGSSIKPPEITGFVDFAKHIPFAIFTALFRPLPGEVPNIFGFLQGLENIFLLLLLFVAVRRTRLKELNDPLILWAIALVFIWASLYGLVTYNLGALVRYRLQILPVFLGLLLYFSRRRSGTAI